MIACGVVQAEAEIGFCTNCSNAAFAWTAEQAAPSTGGTHPVYVIDTLSGEVRFFDVAVSWNCDGHHHPQAMEPRSTGEVIGAGAQVQSNCIRKEAEAGSGDAAYIMHMHAAHNAAREFASTENLTVDSGDIPFSGDSAVDLIGPYDSPAGLNRNGLQNGLADYYEGLWDQILFGWADVGKRIANRFIVNDNYISPLSRIAVHFPDGTSIQIGMSDVSTGPDGSARALMEVLEDTARLPNGAPLPGSQGQFNGFGYSGDAGLVDALGGLAGRFGVLVTGSGGGGRIACSIVDSQEIRCSILPQ